MVLVFGLATCQFSPPLGEVTTMAVFCVIVKLELLMSVTKASVVFVTLTEHCVEGVFGTGFHVYDDDEVLDVRVFQVVPLSAVYSTFHGPLAP